MANEAVPDVDDAPLLDGSLGFNKEWQEYRAGRRFVGGKSVTFKHTAHLRKAERALYDALGRTDDFIIREQRRDALSGSPALTDTGPVDDDWITVTAYAKAKGIGPRKARKVMLDLEFLQEEIEARFVPCITDPSMMKSEYQTTRRLAHWAVEAGFGKRIEPGNRPAYDMISPDGQAWLDARWPEQEVPGVKPVGRPVSSLRDDVKMLMIEGKSQAEIARIMGKSRSTINHHVQALKAA